jgi:arginyl-tRNA synthetase
MFAAALERLAADGIVSLGPDDLPGLLEQVRETADAKFGDYSGTMAMALAKRAGKKPRDVAVAIIERLDVGDVFEKPTEPVGPGFINLKVRDDALAKAVAEACGDARLGVALVADPETIVVDYSSPNVAKPMHVGHIRSTVIGTALARILNFRGHTTITDNHLGDWGTQFGMILWGWKHCRDDAAFAADPTAELGRLYRLVRKVADAKPEELAADPAAAALAKQYPDAGREVLLETAKLHEGDAENRALWERFMPVCRREIDRIYARLDVSFDHTLGESFYQPMLADVVSDLEAKSLARESRGAVGVFLDGEEKPPLLIRKADGAFLYATTDLATIDFRLTELGADTIWYVVGAPQQLHFEQIFTIAKRRGQTADLRHIAFGSILGKDRKMLKTRSGDTVQLADVLTLGKVLWLMVEPQAESRKVSPEEFAKSFDGDTLAAAYKALINEMVFFCPTRQRKALTLAVQKILDVEARAEEMVNENMEEFEREIDRAIDNWTRGSSRTSLPESSESIPATGPSAGLSTPSEAEDARTGITPALSSPN